MVHTLHRGRRCRACEREGGGEAAAKGLKALTAAAAAVQLGGNSLRVRADAIMAY